MADDMRVFWSSFNTVVIGHDLLETAIAVPMKCTKSRYLRNLSPGASSPRSEDKQA